MVKKQVKIYAILTVAGYCALFAISVYLLDFVKNRSTSVNVDFFSIAAWALMTLVVSLFETMLISELFSQFSSKEVEEKEDYGSIFRLTILHRSMLFVVLIVLNFLAANAVSGNFWSGYYAKKGVYMTVLRGGENEKVKWAFDRIVRIPDENIAEFIEPVADYLKSEVSELRRNSALCLGEIARRMNASVSMLTEKEIKENRWEIGLLAEIRKKIVPLLIERFHSDSEEGMRAASAYAIGASGSKEAFEVFEKFLNSPDRSAAVEKEIIKAAYLSGRLEALKILEAGISSKDGVTQALSLYAAGELISAMDMGDRGRLEAVTAFLEAVKGRFETFNIKAKCALVDALAKIKDAGFTGHLISLFESEEGGATCERLEVERYYTAPIVVTVYGVLRHKILNAIAGIAVGNEEVRIFLNRISSEDKYLEDIRELAVKMLDELNASK